MDKNAKLFFVNEDGFVFLTDAGRQVPVCQVTQALEKAGIKISRSSVWRLQHDHTECFQPEYHQKFSCISSCAIGFVQLTEEDKEMAEKLSLRAFARGFGISAATATRFLVRGWFEVNASNEARVRLAVDPERILPPDVF